MSRSVNLVVLLGHIGKDAEVRHTRSGVAVVSFSLATSRHWKDKDSGEWREETDWHRVEAWRVENLAPYLTKGQQVHVQGRLKTDTWEAEGGVKRSATKVVAEQIVLTGGGSGGGRRSAGEDSGPAPEPRSAEPYMPPGITDDDVPF